MILADQLVLRSVEMMAGMKVSMTEKHSDSQKDYSLVESLDR